MIAAPEDFSDRPDPRWPAPAPADLGLAPGEDMWVFGYGSLIWNPGFDPLEGRPAVVHGFHRRFCVLSHRYRGTEACPGLVLGLDRGGSCRGMAFRVAGRTVAPVLDYLWAREMVTGVYRPSRLRARLLHPEVGRRITVTTFVVRRDHRQYAGRLGPDETAAIIRHAVGRRGSCRDYLGSTIQHLTALGVPDRQLEDLERRLQQQEPPRPAGDP